MDDLISRLRQRAEFEDERVLKDVMRDGFEPVAYTGSESGRMLRQAADALEAAQRAVVIATGERNRVQAKWDKCRINLRAAREDRARLDWLDANWFSAYRSCDPIDGLAKHCVVVDESKQSRRGYTGTIREAIDAARGARNG